MIKLPPMLASAVACAALGATLPAHAVNLATDGIGEAAVVPYYTVRDGWMTLLQLTNTRDVPIVIKVRFMEFLNGRDVLNFDVALAANDVFAGSVREAADGSGPVFVASDQDDVDGRRTCTVPSTVAAPGTETAFSTLAFGPPGSENDDGGPSGNGPDAVDRLREGHIQLIVMGYAEGTDQGVNGGGLASVGDAIQSFNCNVIESAFSTTNILATARQFGEPINALSARFALLNPGRGTEGVGVATAWANFYNRDAQPKSALITPTDNAACQIERTRLQQDKYIWFPDGSNNSCRNLISAQGPITSLEPSFNDAYPAIATWWNDEGNYPSYAQPTARTTSPTDPATQAPRGIDALSLTIQRSAIVNSWSSNSKLGVSTDWVVTLPTKGFYVDGGAGTNNLGPGSQSALNDRRGWVYIDGASEPYLPFPRAFGQLVSGDLSSASSCSELAFYYFDRTTDDSLLSCQDPSVVCIPGRPDATAADNMCFATEIVLFNGLSGLAPGGASTGGVIARRMNVETNAVTNEAGWARAEFGEDINLIEAAQAADPLIGTVENHRGLPVVGFSYKQRTFGDVTRNYGSIGEHQHVRAVQ